MDDYPDPGSKQDQVILLDERLSVLLFYNDGYVIYCVICQKLERNYEVELYLLFICFPCVYSTYLSALFIALKNFFKGLKFLIISQTYTIKNFTLAYVCIELYKPGLTKFYM